MFSDRECGVCGDELDGSYEDISVSVTLGPFTAVTVYLCDYCHSEYKQWRKENHEGN